ncbi:response regulator transcription factor [Planotetraspora sp. A-T 1434]|uniref:response regulator n=1 Tax=Planotetraspora sp. A-T 1434 TaxID=2979219 RepID=UPI0021C03C1C|nr:response regulator transcription factor [Planotetraspora sp. A-T 1434]MCT9930534.1 response regulator transcription factor [Planotetraspora sp. A-T 1434]
MSSDRIRIVVADDHTLLREALCELLRAEPDFQVVGQAGDARNVVSAAAKTQPDVVLLDIEMPGRPPAYTTMQLGHVSPRSTVVVLTMHDDPRIVQEMLAAGARGYLHKGISRQDLATAIRSVHRSTHRVIVAPRPQNGVAPSGPRPLLTEREEEVLVLVAWALSNRQIAVRLSITEGTVKRHLRNIFGKLGAVSRLDAVNRAKATSGSFAQLLLAGPSRLHVPFPASCQPAEQYGSLNYR